MPPLHMNLTTTSRPKMIASPNQNSTKELELPELLELFGDISKGKIISPCPACGAGDGALQVGRRSRKADWEWSCKACRAGGGCLSYLMARGSIPYTEALHRYEVISELPGPLWMPAEYRQVSQSACGSSTGKQPVLNPTIKATTDL